MTQRSPPPLQHPIPTHPLNVPEPPATPSTPESYKRFTSSPPSQHGQQYSQQPQFYQGYPSNNAPNAAPQQRQRPAPATGPGASNAGFGANAGMWGVNDATAQLGLQLGQNAVQAGHEYMQKNFGSNIQVPILKHHFNVSNSYVLHKLRILLFPWRHKPWSRRVLRSENGHNEWQPPREDLNAPDLYIPSMALVTYVLLAAVQSGLAGSFNPEILGVRFSKALAVVLIEFVFVKAGCYFLNIPGQSQLVDLVAYGGYKFVGIIPILLASLSNLSRTLYWLVFLYAFCSTAFFLLRSLRYVVLPEANSAAGNMGTISQAQRGRRIGFLFIVAVSQIIYLFVLQ